MSACRTHVPRTGATGDRPAGGGGGESASALATAQKMADEDPESTAISRCWLALTHDYLGVERWQMGKPAEAETEFRTALAIQQRLVDENPSLSFNRDRLGCCLIYLGDVLRSLGRAADAKGWYERAIALKEAGRSSGSDEPGAPLRAGLLNSPARVDPPRTRRPRRCRRRCASSTGVVRRAAATVGVGDIRDRGGLLPRGARGPGRAGRIGGLGGRRRGGGHQGDGMATTVGYDRLPQRESTPHRVGPRPAPRPRRLQEAHRRLG